MSTELAEIQNTCRLHGAGVISDGEIKARGGGWREGLATSSLAQGPLCCCCLGFRVQGPHQEASLCPCFQLHKTLALLSLVPVWLPAKICPSGIKALRTALCTPSITTDCAHRPIWQTMKKGSQRNSSSLEAEEKRNAPSPNCLLFPPVTAFFRSILRQISQEGPVNPLTG